MLDLSPISDVDEDGHDHDNGVWETQMIATQVLLQLLLLPEFYAMAYQEDVVRLARASRVALEPYVDESLAFIRHVVMEHDDWHHEWCIERSGAMQTEMIVIAEDRMCLSCGMRPGVAWLGHTECNECFSEH